MYICEKNQIKIVTHLIYQLIQKKKEKERKVRKDKDPRL